MVKPQCTKCHCKACERAAKTKREYDTVIRGMRVVIKELLSELETSDELRRD